jgi:rsbT antagonist protein RsbS
MNIDNQTYADTPAVALQVSRGIVVASIQVDLEERVLARFQDELLQRVHETGASGVILDVSGLAIMDSQEFAALRKVIRSTEIMGAKVIVAGLSAGIVSSLIQAGAEIDGLEAAIDLDAAFSRLEKSPQDPGDATHEVEADDDELIVQEFHE